MKKFLTIAAVAFAAFATVSCDKENGTENNNGEGNENTTSRKVLLALPSQIDEEGNLVKGRSFRYNSDGSLAGIDEVWFEDEERKTYDLNVVKEGNVLKLTEVDGTIAYEMEINEKGYVTKSISGNSVYTYEYDNEDHLIKVYEKYKDYDVELKSQITWENGNMTSWSQEKYEDKDGDGVKDARVKRQTYTKADGTTDPNVGGIHVCYNDKNANLKKWMLEAGFFGKPSKDLVVTDAWDGSESIANFEYNTDDDDYVMSETKYYGNEVDAQTYYIWQVAE